MLERRLIGLQFLRFSISPFFGMSLIDAERKFAVRQFFS
jgi:hypothetical protein